MSNESPNTPANGHHDGAARTPGEAPNWARIQYLSLLAAAIGFGLFAVIGLLRGAIAETGGIRQFFASYLTGYITWLGIPIGAMVLLMIHHLALGRWGYVLRKVFEANIRCFPVMAALFIPVALGLFIEGKSIYWWANPLPEVVNADDTAEVAHHAELEHKVHDYLNVPFALGRGVVILAIWGLLIFLLNRISQQGYASKDLKNRERLKALSGPGLMVHALAMTVFATDWVMSLEPTWASTMFPVIFGITQILCAYAFSLAVLLLMSRGPMKGELSNLDQINLGSFLLAFTLFWTYISFSQFMLVWIGNLPEEIPFYLKRMSGGWEIVMVTLFIFHFALPFLLLLYRDVKTSNKWLFRVAVGLLVVCAFDVFVWVEPTFTRSDQPLYWLMDLGAVIGVGGLYLFTFVRQYKDNWTLPTHEDHLFYREHAHHHE